MHVILWEFTVRTECVAAFEAAYGPEGDWVQLFRRADGYMGTELLRCGTDHRRFITIDRWRDEADYLAFQEQFREQYQQLDLRLEGLTAHEKKIGVYSA